MRGRKPKYESRAAEFRQRLIGWKQTPDSIRQSLRALATELGTTHQMLGYCLKGLEEWQYKERYQRAKQRAQERAEQIRERAAADNREMTWRECLDAIVIPGWLEQVESMRQAAKRGPLNWYQGQMLKIYARRGLLGAKELLQKCSQFGIRKRKRFAEIVRDTPRREDETYTSWVQRIWEECEKYGTSCPTVITEELLEKCSQRKSEKSEEKFASNFLGSR